MAAQYPEELTCDMAETYHVLDWRALGLPLAATLAAGMRETSRTTLFPYTTLFRDRKSVV